MENYQLYYLESGEFPRGVTLHEKQLIDLIATILFRFKARPAFFIGNGDISIREKSEYEIYAEKSTEELEKDLQDLPLVDMTAIEKLREYPNITEDVQLAAARLLGWDNLYSHPILAKSETIQSILDQRERQKAVEAEAKRVIDEIQPKDLFNQ